MPGNKVWLGVVVLAAVSFGVLFALHEALGGKASAPALAVEDAAESDGADTARWPARKERPALTHDRPPSPAARAPNLETAGTSRGATPPAAAVDRSEVLAATVAREYAADGPPSREALGKQKVLETLFAKLGDTGRLEELACREKVCRGVVRIARASADGEVFQRTLLSSEFASAIHDAVSVPSRQSLPDGAVLATFFTHPQSVFEMVATATGGNESR